MLCNIIPVFSIYSCKWSIDYKRNLMIAKLYEWIIQCHNEDLLFSVREGTFVNLPDKTNEAYNALRRRAAILKQKYIEESDDGKKEYLSLFLEAERLLETDYIDYLPEMDAKGALLCLDKRMIIKKDKFIQSLQNTK